MIVVETETLVVPSPAGAVHVVSVSDEYTVVGVSDDVVVVANEETTQVVSLNTGPTVIPVFDEITIVANPVTVQGTGGAKITVSSTAPLSPNVGDLWIME